MIPYNRKLNINLQYHQSIPKKLVILEGIQLLMSSLRVNNWLFWGAESYFIHQITVQVCQKQRSLIQKIRSGTNKILYHLLTMTIQTLTLFLLVAMAVSRDPPTFQKPFQTPFTVTYNSRSGTYHTTGQTFYDGPKGKERVDFANGQHNFICNSIVRGVATPCQSITVNKKRWQVFPERKVCCLCCTSEQGCGILRPDWLKDADYQGEHEIDNKNYSLWHERGATTDDYYYVDESGNPKCRRLREDNSLIYDYDLNNYKEGELPDSVFALPSYCNEASPKKCPLTSVCSVLAPRKKNLKTQ